MRIVVVRKALLVSLAVVGIWSALPASGSTTYGTITLTAPANGAAVRGVTPVTWVWKSGTYVKSTSKVEVSLSTNGLTWTTLATNIPIRFGSYDWDTTLVTDRAYAIRVRVLTSSATIASVRAPVYVDNTVPVVKITRPSQGDVIVDDETKATVTVVAGRATLHAEAADALSGVASIEWQIDGTAIGTGTPYTYDFNGVTPGEHTLTVVATDVAGNTASHSIRVVTLPGPSAVESPLPSPDPSATPTPPAVPSPDPSALPTPPALPSPDPSPSPTPPAVPMPDPSALPSLLP